MLLLCVVHEETYKADLDNEYMHGEYLVAYEADEKVDRKHVSAIVICRPCTSPDEIGILKASVTSDTISIVGPAQSKSFLTNSPQWLKRLKKNEGPFKATKLVSTLTALVTKLKKKERTKTTHICFKELGLELSTDYFNQGMPDGELMMIPLPYDYTRMVGKKQNVVNEVMCVWRAYIVGSETEVDEAQAATGTGNAQYDIMLKMMEDSTL